MAIRGMDKLTAQLERLADMDSGSALLSGAAILQEAAQANAPVKTGALRDSITAREDGPDRAVVEVGADYGFFVEYGTRYQSGHPFIRPAIDAETARIVQAVGQGVEVRMRDIL